MRNGSNDAEGGSSDRSVNFLLILRMTMRGFVAWLAGEFIIALLSK